MQELPRFDIDFCDKEAFCRLEQFASSVGYGGQPKKEFGVDLAEEDFDNT